ncbi:hypothetical protein [Natronomonas marina]|uniref:hypothetical protein n=1 Tax=Natronomonas marina TaxID=2961939 RepID=UPI0020CA1B69|nr:hypothetical protein [Natronomonas marina]
MPEEGDHGVEDPFAVLLPVAMGLVTVAVVVVERTLATLVGTAAGVGLVVIAGLLRYRESRQNADDE